MKYAAAAFFAGLALRAQIFPIAVGPVPNVSTPAVDYAALTAVVSSSVSSDGVIHMASDLYLMHTDGTAVQQLTMLANYGAPYIDLATDGSKAAYNLTSGSAPGMEEIHVVDTSSGADLKVATDTVGCVQPLAAAICYGCFFTCVRTVHLSPDASKVVYSASENQPLYVVNADGSGVLHLQIYSAVLAPSPQRVVSRNGLLVFTTSNGVYTMNLDGSGMQRIATFAATDYPSNATISEDGNTIAFQLQSSHARIYVVHLDGNSAVPFTSDTLDATSPSISADGSLVAFIQSNQAFIQPADGSSPATRLTNFGFLTPSAVALSGDGSTALIKVESGVYAAGTGMTARRVYAPRTILASGITSYSGTSAATPGSLFRISGWNFQDDAAVFANSVPLPTSLGGISVNVNGQPVPLVSITPSQITGQMPFTTRAGGTSLTVDFDGGQELTANATVSSAAPEVLPYTLPFFTSNYAMAFHAGTSIPADQGHPADAGETLETYGVGLGVVSPAVDAGVPAPSDPPARAIVTPQVSIGNKAATVTFAGLAPGMIGIYQVNVVVPGGLKSGSQPISWSPPTASWSIWVK